MLPAEPTSGKANHNIVNDETRLFESGDTHVFPQRWHSYAFGP
jgi:hypothetical protein